MEKTKMIRTATIHWLGRRAAAFPLFLFGIVGRGAAASSPQASKARSPVALEEAPPSLALALANSGPDAGRALASDEAANWDIRFVNLTTDLSADSTDEILLRFDVGKDRVHSAALLAGGCVENITGVEWNATDPVRSPKDDDHDALLLGYSLDKSSLAGSNVWNDAASRLELCHVLKLILAANETLDRPVLEVAADVREISVDVDLSANFSFAQDLITNEAIGMRIFGWVNLTDFAHGVLASQTVEKAVYWVLVCHPRPQSKCCWGIEHNCRFHHDCWRREIFSRAKMNALIITVPPSVSHSAYYYELMLREPCSIACEDLKTSTTMYENVTGHLAEAFDDGSFLGTFRKLWNASRPAARRELSAATPPTEGSVIEGSAIELDGRRLQSGVEWSFKPKPDSDFYPDGEEFVFIISDVRSSSANVDLDDYIESCRCGGAQSFACDATESPLSPSDELRVCVRSVSTDVVLDSLDSMVLIQGSVTLDLIEDDDVSIPAITTREYVPDLNGVAVATRVPSNVFAFAAGRSLEIRGVVVANLAGGGRRELRSFPGAGAGRTLQAADEEASFALEVTLVGEGGSPKLVALSNSASVVEKGFVAIGAVLSVFYNLLW